jgi:hypothetical protein
MEQATCLGFNIACDVLWKGAGVTIMGLLLFVGSVYVLLAAVFGRWMGYLITIIAFAGWMLIQSSMWLFGFWSLGPGTPVDLGPRGREAAWVVEAAGLEPTNPEGMTEFETYPEAPWQVVPQADWAESEPSAIGGAAQTYMAEVANEELGRDEFDLDAVLASQFTVDAMATASAADGTELAVVEAHFNGGGPRTTVSMAYDGGAVSSYGWLFFILSGIVFAVHLPLLDRAERARKEFLTGGTTPAWYGPA